TTIHESPCDPVDAGLRRPRNPAGQGRHGGGKERLMDQAARADTGNTGNGVSEFGYKQEMKRELGWYTSFAVAFGFVSIATGIFTAYGSILGSSGPMGIWAWPVVVVGQLCVALVFGALAARIPVSGYSYQWISRLANPVLGWIMGWVSFTFLAVVV